MKTIDVQTTLEAGMSANGAWNKPQLAMLGVSWPPIKGWKANLIRSGYRFSVEEHALFVSLRHPQENEQAHVGEQGAATTQVRLASG
jgi:hypothetical protein